MGWIAANSLSLNMLSLYAGTIMIIALAAYMAFTFEIKKPSLLHAIHEDIGISNNILIILKRFIFIFLALEFFYLFVFNLIIQWLAMAVDDPIIFIAIFIIILILFRQRHIFNRKNKVSDMLVDKAESLEHFYKKLIGMFHYKKTLPIAVSGILVLQALTDILVYIFPHIFFFAKNSFYARLGIEAEFSFVEAGLLHSSIYIINIIAVIIFLLVPLLIWFSFFYHQKFEFNKYVNSLIAFVYTAFFLSPYFMFKPIISSSFFGVNIALEGFLQRFNLSPLTALLVPFFIAVIVLILSLNHDYEKKISNMIALFSIFFFAYYIFLWSQSSWMYFGSIADASLQFGYVFAGIILYLFMFMTIFFYIAGYLFLLSETIAELVNEKWSNPVDEEIKLLRRKLRRR
jgi:hypothetical protein